MNEYFKILMKPDSWNLLKEESESLHKKVSFVNINDIDTLKKYVSEILNIIDVEVSYSTFFSRTRKDPH